MRNIFLLFAFCNLAMIATAFAANEHYAEVSTTAICKNIIIQLDANGQASILPSDIDNGSTSCSGPPQLSLNFNSFTCIHVGINFMVLTVTDDQGNSDSCTATVTVEDNTNPIAMCGDTTLYLDASGVASITAAEIDNGSFDPCGTGSLSIDVPNFDCSDIGINTVTLTVTDMNGNSNTCTSQVTVQDTLNPIASCKAATIFLDVNGVANLLPADVNNGSSDPCGVQGLSLDKNLFDCDDLGTNTVTLTVTDDQGNSATCMSTITVMDLLMPDAECKDTILALDNNGLATLTGIELDDGSTDPCGIDTITMVQTSFDCTYLGPNVVVLTVTDDQGNTSTCSSVVNVVDVTVPAVACNNISINLDMLGNANITAAMLDNGSTDECGIAGMALSQSSFNCTHIGANDVDLIVTDNAGNTAICTAVVTVNDVIGPTVICQNFTVQLDALGQAVILPSDIDNGSKDTCGIANLDLNITSFDCTDVGTNAVTLTVTDNGGNTASCTAVVTVVSNFTPTATCTNHTVYLDAAGNASVNVSSIDLVSPNSCDFMSMSLDVTTFDCADEGPNVVTLTVTDNSLNTSTCTALVTVRDTMPPLAISQDLTVDLDPTGNVSITPAQVDNGSSDVCGIFSMSLNETSFACSEIGPNTVILSVIDNNGNLDTSHATIFVRDLLNPIATCQNMTIPVDANGQAQISASDINLNSSDDCGINTMSINKTDFDCTNLGTNTVTLTVTDFSGNTSTCSSIVTIQENLTPLAICKNISVQLDGNGVANITEADIDDGSFGMCSGTTLSINRSTFSCADIGDNFVLLTITNPNGMTDNCVAVVTVEDNFNPQAICKNITVNLDNGGFANITAASINNNSTDNCGIANMSIDKTSFDCDEVGDHQVTLMVTDIHGNSASCTSIVTIEDNTAPTVFCSLYRTSLNANGQANVQASDVISFISDACGIDTTVINKTNFDCNDVGPNTITLTVTDVNGNTNSCQANVIIEDNLAPSASCQNLNITLDANGQASILASDLDGGSTDDCAIASMILSKYNFTNSDIGQNAVTLTVMDMDNNASSCTATVTVSPNTNQSTPSIQANVLTANNDVVADVDIELNGVVVPSSTNIYANLTPGNTYTVKPLKDVRDLNGISTFDLVIISQHIVMISTIQDPYLRIAADVNGDGRITTFDLVQLRSLILYETLELPSNTSWRFIDKNYVFPNPLPQMMPAYPEEVTFTAIANGINYADFVAIKIGDMNNSANPDSLNTDEDRAGLEPLSFSFYNQIIKNGEQYKVAVYASNYKDILAYQCALQFNTSSIDFLKLSPGKINLSEEHYGKALLEEGILTISYHEVETENYDAEDALFYFEFTALKNGKLEELIKLTNRYTKAEAYNQAGEVIPVSFRAINQHSNSVEPAEESEFLLFQNKPNPFKNSTQIGFNLPKAQHASLKIFDINGKLIQEYKGMFKAGYNEISISASILNAKGLYYYQLDSEEKSSVKRMILLN